MFKRLKGLSFRWILVLKIPYMIEALRSFRHDSMYVNGRKILGSQRIHSVSESAR
jgi:hypothetical protein